MTDMPHSVPPRVLLGATGAHVEIGSELPFDPYVWHCSRSLCRFRSLGSIAPKPHSISDHSRVYDA